MLKKVGFLSLVLLLLVSGCITHRPLPAIIMEFSTNPATINLGGSSTLLWNVTGSTSVSVDQGIGQVNVAGTKIVSPSTSTVYTISATNSAGDITQTSAMITVNPASPPLTAAKRIPLIQIPGYLTYMDNENGFAILYPQTWFTSNAILAKNGIAFISTQNLNDIHSVASAASYDVNTNMPDFDFQSMIIKRNQENGWNKISETKIIIAEDTPAVQVTFQNKDGVLFLGELYFIDKNNKKYWIQYNCASDYLNLYKYDIIFNNMTNSFRFLQ